MIKPTPEKKLFEKNIGGQNPFFVIAGPCVIESRDLLLQVAEVLAKSKQQHNIEVIFKASYDKANRSSHSSFRGPGIDEGLTWLQEIREQFSLPILTDVHDVEQAKRSGQVVDMLQIPAFLCRQTDLLVAAAQTQKWVNVKKGQFLSPADAPAIVEKIQEAGSHKVFITERGYTFGYNNLVVDMRSFAMMREQNIHVIFDATHSTQLPGGGKQSGGQREMTFPLARAAVAAGIDGLFTEVHPSPPDALSDASNQMYLKHFDTVIEELLEIDAVVKKRS